MEVAEKNEHLLRKLTQKVSVIFTKLTEKIIIEWMLTFKFYPQKTLKVYVILSRIFVRFKK